MLRSLWQTFLRTPVLCRCSHISVFVFSYGQLATAEELLTWKTACLTLESDLKKQQEIDENLQCQLKKFSEYLESDRSGLLSKQEQIEFLQASS